MKPYGLPRLIELIYPDKADIKHFGLKSKFGKLKNRKPSRRIWKKRERLRNKWKINAEIVNFKTSEQ